jgi:RNA polymerase sporulation-specific sigma factor
MINETAERVIKAREDKGECLKIIGDFEPLVKKCIKMYIKDNDRCEDAMQEGRITILSCIKNYDLSSPAPFEAYVKMAVIYSIKNLGLKYREHISLDEELTEEGGSLHDLLDSGIDLEGDAVKREELKNLGSALDKLPEGERKLIKEFYLEGKTMREMSKGKRCHYMTVVRRKERALGKLRELVG